MIDLANGRINRFVLAPLAAILLAAAPVSPVFAEESAPVVTPTFTFAALPLPTPTYGTGELTIQRSSAPDATSYQFTATIMGNGVFVGTNNSRTYTLNTDPQHGGATAQYVICVPETVMIDVADSTGAVVASLAAGANQAGSKDLRSCPESPSEPADADNDGVTDDKDLCPGTLAGTPVDASGCTLVVVRPDVDVDGVPDDGPDQCLGTLPGVVVDATGCPVVIEPVDSDNDGVTNDVDNCDDVAGPAANGGCPVVVPPQPPTTVEVEVKADSLKDNLQKGCPAGQEIIGAHFVITQSVDDEGANVSPTEISVQLSNLTTVTAPRIATTGGVAHYGLSLAAGITVANATALLPSTWTGEFNLSHYNCGEPVPPVDVCPDMKGDQPAGTDCNPVVVPVTCPSGKIWNDANANGKVDEGECTEPVSPVVVTPVVVPPVVVPPVVVPPVVVVTPLVSTPVDTAVDETNGRGMTIETAAVETAAVGSENQLGGGLIGLCVAGVLSLAFAAARRRQSTSSK